MKAMNQLLIYSKPNPNTSMLEDVLNHQLRNLGSLALILDDCFNSVFPERIMTKSENGMVFFGITYLAQIHSRC